MSAASGAEFSIPPGVDRLARQLARLELDEQLYAVAGYRPVVAARGERTAVCRYTALGATFRCVPESRGRVMTDRIPPSNRGDISEDAIVFIVDDDPIVRGAISTLLLSVGRQVQQFASATELLQSSLPPVPCCLVLDIRLPGRSGLDVQAELANAGLPIPVIFITGHGDIPMSVRAMKAGAIDFLTKPFRDQDLLDAVTRALERDRKRRNDEKDILDLRASFRTLTPREKQIMALVTDGLMNKQVADRAGISEVTAKTHRGRVMKKMGAKSLADLVVMAETLGVRGKPPQET